MECSIFLPKPEFGKEVLEDNISLTKKAAPLADWEREW